MRLSDFNYHLPKTLIAQQALPKRSDARLLVLDRKSGKIRHDQFRSLPDYLKPGDVLVLNDTKVLPARFFARKETGGRVEILLLHEIKKGRRRKEKLWKALLKPSGRVKKGAVLSVERKGKSRAFSVRVVDEPSGSTGVRHLAFDSVDPRREMEKNGRIPLPPYIEREDLPIDRDTYQTVFARRPGSIASPTAGLHFDPPLLAALRARGVEIVFLTLHVSYGTFQPVVCEDVSQHVMYPEQFEITKASAERLNRAKKEGRRIVACGTTAIRALESASSARAKYSLRAMKGSTQLFIYPPYQFKMADAIITNFHLPRTTLLMLVAAFSGKDNLDRAYREAIRKQYRFYSYGDAMLII